MKKKTEIEIGDGEKILQKREPSSHRTKDDGNISLLYSDLQNDFLGPFSLRMFFASTTFQSPWDIWVWYLKAVFLEVSYILRMTFVPTLYHHELYICWKSHANETIAWKCDLVVATGAPSIEPASRQDFKIKRTAKKILRPTKPCVGILFVKMKDGPTEIIFL